MEVGKPETPSSVVYLGRSAESLQSRFQQILYQFHLFFAYAGPYESQATTVPRFLRLCLSVSIDNTGKPVLKEANRYRVLLVIAVIKYPCMS